MINLFKPFRTQKRCEHELALLKIGLLKVREEKAKIKQTLRHDLYIPFLVKEADIESDIRLLTGILNDPQTERGENE